MKSPRLDFIASITLFGFQNLQILIGIVDDTVYI